MYYLCIFILMNPLSFPPQFFHSLQINKILTKTAQQNFQQLLSIVKKRSLHYYKNYKNDILQTTKSRSTPEAEKVSTFWMLKSAINNKIVKGRIVT